MSEVVLPTRPRLAEHAMARRHFIDGEEIVVVHDARSGDLVRMPPRAWALIEAADGTRDLGGLLLAASQRGALERESEVVAVLTDLAAAGLLADGIDPFVFDVHEEEIDAATPLDVLPFTLTCDGSGACCATYSTVRFSEDEAARARALLPHQEGGHAKKFLPLAGSGAQPSCAVTMIDGRCAYLGGDGACELHRRHGVGAKPSGCAIYPATFAYDGEAVRVSLGVECACVAKSLESKEIGTPLAPEEARVRGDLPAGAQVVVVPARIEVSAGKPVVRAEVVFWSRAVIGAFGEALAADGAEERMDVAAIAWALAAKVEARDLSSGGVRAAMEEARAGAIAKESLSPWIEALSEKTAAKREAADRWRSARDRVRVASAWIAEAAAALKDPEVLAKVLGGEGAARKLEVFYWIANVHGHGWIGEVPLSSALRDRAVRVLLGRSLARIAAARGGELGEPWVMLTLVEAMMRAQGLKEYARTVP